MSTENRVTRHVWMRRGTGVAVAMGLLLAAATVVAAPPAAVAPKGKTAAAPASAAAPAEKVTGIAYDKLKDQVTIIVENQPLSDVLLQIARQSGVDMRMDPQVETQVTVNINKLPLETALDRLGHLNIIKQYKSVASGKARKKLLVGVAVLPEGKLDPSAAVRLMDADKEVDYRSGAVSMAMQSAKRHRQQQLDLMVQRWQARMGDLTAAQKKHYDERMKAFADRAAEREQRAAERDAKHQQIRDARVSRLPPNAKARAALSKTDGQAPDPAAAADAARVQADFPQTKTPAVIAKP